MDIKPSHPVFLQIFPQFLRKLRREAGITGTPLRHGSSVNNQIIDIHSYLPPALPKDHYNARTDVWHHFSYRIFYPDTRLTHHARNAMMGVVTSKCPVYVTRR